MSLLDFSRIIFLSLLLHFECPTTISSRLDVDSKDSGFLTLTGLARILPTSESNRPFQLNETSVTYVLARYYEVIMIDIHHAAITRDPKINWMCAAVQKHRELRGLTAAGEIFNSPKIKYIFGCSSFKPRLCSQIEFQP